MWEVPCPWQKFFSTHPLSSNAHPMGIPAKVSLTNGFPHAPMKRELDVQLPWTGELPRAMSGATKEL